MRKTFRQPHALAAMVIAMLMAQLSGCATTSAQTSPTEFGAGLPEAEDHSESAEPQSVDRKSVV